MLTRLSLLPMLGQKEHVIVRRRTRRPGKLRPAMCQIMLDGCNCLAPDGHQAFLIPLADAANAAHAHVEIGDAQIQQFGHAQPVE